MRTAHGSLKLVKLKFISWEFIKFVYFTSRMAHWSRSRDLEWGKFCGCTKCRFSGHSTMNVALPVEHSRFCSICGRSNSSTIYASWLARDKFRSGNYISEDTIYRSSLTSVMLTTIIHSLLDTLATATIGLRRSYWKDLQQERSLPALSPLMLMSKGHLMRKSSTPLKAQTAALLLLTEQLEK